MRYSPKKMKRNSTMHMYTAISTMCLTIFLETMWSDLSIGGLSRRIGFGLSVARARAASESMIKFTQRSWMAWRGVSPVVREETSTVKHALTLTVS